MKHTKINLKSPVNNMLMFINMLIFIPIILCYRLLKLKLKEKDDLFLTNANGSLKLLPPDIENQTIKIHNRKLTFVKYASVYKFFMNKGSLEIKFRKVEEERHKIGFLRSGVRRKRVNPFGYLAKRAKLSPKEFLKNKVVDQQKKEVKEVKELGESPKKEVVLKETKNIKKEDTTYSLDNPPETQKDENEGDDEAKQLELLKNIISSLDGESEEKTPKVKPHTVEKKDDSLVAKLKQIFKKKQGRDEDVYIESDSKLEDETAAEQFIDVFVSSINRTYFELKTATNNCVTYMENVFIFAPCINIDNQIFLTVNEEEVRRKMKEHTALMSYEKRMRTKYKATNCDDYHKVCFRGSLMYDEGTCKTLQEECEKDSYDEESSRAAVPLARPLDSYPFPKPLTSHTNKPNEYTNKPNDFTIPPTPIGQTISPPKPEIQPPKTNFIKDFKASPEPSPSPSSLRDIIKTEANKKDFSPDDIIEKLKKSIKSNDFSDLIS